MTRISKHQAEQIKDALESLVNWQDYCLNAHLPADRKQERTQPNDDDLCELFGRIQWARNVLRQIEQPGQAA